MLRVFESGKVLVEGVNRVKKHQRPNPVKGQTGRHRRQGNAARTFQRDARSTPPRARAIASDSSSSRRRRATPRARCASSSPTAKSWTFEPRDQRDNHGDKDQKWTRTRRARKDAKHAGAKAAPAPTDKPAKEAKKPKQAKADKPVEKEAAPTQPPRLQVQYRETIVPALMKQFGYKTRMQVPRVTKITLNMGVGEAVADKKMLENAAGDLQKIAGQKPVDHQVEEVDRRASRSAPGYPVGVMVTLRNRRMYEFLDRLVTIALPRVRDFRGVSARAPSTGAATTTWASRNRSSSRRSSTTRSTRSGV